MSAGSVMVRSILMGLAALAAVGCGSGNVAGGTGSETTTLAARLVHADGTPAAGASVRLIDVDRWGRRVLGDSAAAIDSVRADTAGRFAFVGVPRGMYAIEAALPGEALRVSDVSALAGPEWSPGDLAMKRPATLSGTLRSGAGRPERVVLAGTGLTALVDSAGRFVFQDVPPGTYDVLAGIGSSGGPDWAPAGRAVLAEGDAVDNPEIVVSPRQIVLDDFDDGDRYTRIAPLQGFGWWFYHDDTLYGGRSALEPAAAERDLGRAMNDSSAHAGKALHVRFRIDGGAASGFALLAMQIGPRAPSSLTRGWADLSGMDSLVFWAKGAGHIRLQFTTRDINEDFGGSGHFEAGVDLQPDWARHVVRRDQILRPAGARTQGPAWSDAGREVATINVLAVEDAELWLDDLVAHGPDIGAFLGGNPQ